MKKLFVSCPMKGREDGAIEESIIKLHRMAEVILGEKLELINPYEKPTQKFPEGTADNKIAIWYLAKSLNKMKDADYVIGCRFVPDFAGCNIEMETARQYEIRCIPITEDQLYIMMPDVDEMMRNKWKEEVAAIPTKGI